MAPAIQTQRGRDKLTHDGHVYVFSALNAHGTKEHWRCQFKASKKHKCNARVHKCIDTGEIEVLGVHSDMPNAAAVEVQKKKTTLKRRAADSLETPYQIISKVRIESTVAAQGALESNKGLKSVKISISHSVLVTHSLKPSRDRLNSVRRPTSPNFKHNAEG